MRTNTKWVAVAATLAIVATGTGPASAGPPLWQVVPGLVGGGVLELIDDGAGTLYAATSGGGVFKSTNGGGSWQRASNGISLRDLEIKGIAIDASGSLYASANGGGGATSGVYKSTDGGANWTQLATFNSDVSDVFVDPSGAIFAGVGGFSAVQRSTDGGASFSNSSSGIPSTFGLFINVLGFAHDGTNQWAFQAANVLKSTDGGVNWTAMNNGIPLGTAITSLAVEGTDLYIGTNVGVYKSTDGAANWALMNDGIEYNPFGSFIAARSVTAVGAAGTDTLYAAGTRNDEFTSALYKTTDGGANWTEVFEPLTEARTILASGGTIYAGTDGIGVLASSNAGGTWSEMNDGLTAVHVSALLDHASGLFVGSPDLDVSFSTNGGASFTTRTIEADGLNPPFTEVNALVQDSFGDLYAGVDGGSLTGGMLKSTNAASSWAEANTGYAIGFSVPRTSRIEVGPNNALYADGSPNLFGSTDGAQNWTSLSPILALTALLAADNGDIYYTTNTLQRSTDGGLNFNPVDTGSAFEVGIFQDSGGTLHAFDGIGSRTSSDGTTWSGLSTGLPSGHLPIDFADDGAGNLYVSVGAAVGQIPGVYTSSDGGSTWSEMNTGLPTLEVTALLADASGALFAGTDGAGLYAMGLPEPASGLVGLAVVAALAGVARARRAPRASGRHRWDSMPAWPTRSESSH